MDEKIKKIQRTNRQEGRQLASLLKADKKQDRLITAAKHKTQHSKKAGK